MIKLLNFLYGIICYSFHFAIFALMAILFGGKIFLGRYIYFGDFKKDLDDYNYLGIINVLESLIFYACIFWILSTLFILTKYDPRINRNFIIAGVVGFFLSVIYFIVDPFGTWKMLMR